MDSTAFVYPRQSRLETTLETLEGMAVIGFSLVTPFLRRLRRRWGTRGDEAARTLPGDELLPSVRWTSTHAIEIRATPAQIWPWLVQIGQGRGGLYSYEVIENWIGSQIHNADRILPEYQRLGPGDSISLAPAIDPLPVHTVEPHQWILLGGPRANNPKLGGEIGVTWLFFLQPQTSGTRLLVRWRVDYEPKWQLSLSFGPWFVEPIHFAMERKMLLGLKARVEASRREDSAD